MKKKQAENCSRVGASVESVVMLVSKIADTPTRVAMVPLCPRRSVWGKHSAWMPTPHKRGGFLAQNRAEARLQCRSHFEIAEKLL